MLQEPQRSLAVLDLARWLVGPARIGLTPVEIVAGCCERLLAAGMTLYRVRVGQRLANPLIGAWGVIWMRETGAEEYAVPRTTLATGSYTGSPFEHVVKTRTRFRGALRDLDLEQDHPVLYELAATGSIDYLAIPIAYGDGSVQGASFTTDSIEGFSPEEVAFIEDLSPFLAASLEPAAMRRSAESLLRTYLGDGPAKRVMAGAIRRGDWIEIEAAVLLTDLRGYTALSEQLPPGQLLDQLGRYLGVVVGAVQSEGGDVLKFIGDGVLSIFPVGKSGQAEAIYRALRALETALTRADQAGNLHFIGCLHVGSVTYGNIGSPDRLDFTAVGPTVNLVSRLEMVAKSTSHVAVCSREVAALLPVEAASALGTFALRGVPDEQTVFQLCGLGKRTQPLQLFRCSYVHTGPRTDYLVRIGEGSETRVPVINIRCSRLRKHLMLQLGVITVGGQRTLVETEDIYERRITGFLDKLRG